MIDLDDVRFCEEITFNSWPSLATLYVDGWLARFADGVTGRSNSLNALNPNNRPLDEVIATAAPYYAARGLPMMLRLTPLCPAGTREAMVAKGWRIEKESHVFRARLAGDLPLDPAIAIAPSSSEHWREQYIRANPRFDPNRLGTIAAIHAAIIPQAGFAVLSEEGEIRALGLAVVERGAVSLHEIATMGNARGRGVGRRLVGSLLAWAWQQGARRAILQVQGDNVPAIRLYQSLGFEPFYDYAYALAP